MTSTWTGTTVPHSLTRCLQVEPARHVPDLAQDARDGLLAAPRSLPPKYFYDDRGARLFERICETAEYYLTRTEDDLLRRHSGEIVATVLPAQILELGSGSSRKTRRLLNACHALAHSCEYAPFDVCETALYEAAGRLRSEYDWLEVTPLLGDYHAGLRNLPVADGCTLFVFLGSTIGNFRPAEARRLVGEIRNCMQAGDFFLLGADRVKDPVLIRAAYNDSAGVTAEFNLNLLRVLNRELNADFDLDGFRHEALYNEDLGRIEMYLVSVRAQTVCLGDLDACIRLHAGERILTELSYKFRRSQIESLLSGCGLNVVRHFESAGAAFSLLLAAAA